MFLILAGLSPVTLPMCERAGFGKACRVTDNLKADDCSRVDSSVLVCVTLTIRVYNKAS